MLWEGGGWSRGLLSQKERAATWVEQVALAKGGAEWWEQNGSEAGDSWECSLWLPYPVPARRPKRPNTRMGMSTNERSTAMRTA